MIAELNELGTGDEAARWAKRRYPDKTKRLNEADAEHIDQCFRTKLLSFAAHDAEGVRRRYGGTSLKRRPTQRTRRQEAKAVETNRQEPLDVPEPRRVRDREHVRTWLINHAWSAAASPAMPIICALRKAARSDARSAMSSPSHCAVGIIASFIAMAMKPRGGARPPSSHSRLPGLWLETHPQVVTVHAFTSAPWTEIRSASSHATEV